MSERDERPALPEPIGRPVGAGDGCGTRIVDAQSLLAAVAQRDEQIAQFRETIRKITRVLVSAGFASDRSFIWDDVQRMADTIIALRAEVEALRALVNTPQLHDFSAAVVLEAAHQRQRWGSAHDAGKAPEDWFWLLGYLGGKALAAAKAGDKDKALHHTISSGAALANWHAALCGEHTAMRPGIDPAAHAINAARAEAKPERSA